MNLKCIECTNSYSSATIRYQCECGGLLAVQQDSQNWSKCGPQLFDSRLSSRSPEDRSGVWRFREVVMPGVTGGYASLNEGSTPMYAHQSFTDYSGIEDLKFKHEGMNPTGSFKDRGMACAINHANLLGQRVVGCASTGNTSASLAAYAARVGLQAVVFIPDGKISTGKLSQAVAYGAKVIALSGDFDHAMETVRNCAMNGQLYMVNSLNPFRLEGQKTIMWEMLQDLGWQAPDWVVVPGGNLGNTSAFGKALAEAHEAGWIDKLPQIAVIQAEGASPFFKSFKSQFQSFKKQSAKTLATAIQIGNPVNYPKARRVIDKLKGVVHSVSDEDILAAKSVIDSAGVGCEPASACSLAGARALFEQGIIKKNQKVVGILTGHVLKDTEIVFQSRPDAVTSMTDPESTLGRFLEDLQTQ